MTEITISVRKTNKQEEARKKQCFEQLTLDRQRLLLKWPFIGSLIMRMDLVPVRDDRLTTASTNGEDIFVDINFYNSLTKDERLFVLAHEVWHTALLHFARKMNRDHERFNYAADLEIHFALLDEKMSEPWVLPHNPAWKGLSAEEIYDRLENFSKQDFADSSKINDNFGNHESSFDKHVYQGDYTADEQSKVPVDSKAELCGKDVEFVMDDDYSPGIAPDAVESVRQRVISAAQQVERRQGKLPGAVHALLDKLMNPEMPWQELLKQYLTTCYGGKRQWLPPSQRHVWQGLYLPSMRSERLRAVVALDTSGSTQEDLTVFFGELMGLMNSFGKFELTVYQCDEAIQSEEHFDDGNPVPPDYQWKVHGLGGTSFIPVFDEVAKQAYKPDVLLYFTDGYGDAPAEPPGYPVLWVLVRDGIQPASWGHAIHFKQN